jgi:nucleoside-diphosphate-sugar epimerase
LHAIGDGGVPFRDIAEVIARKLGVPSASIAPEEAAAQFSFLARFISMDNPTSGELTQDLLGWEPTHPGLIEDLEDGHYFDHASELVG